MPTDQIEQFERDLLRAIEVELRRVAKQVVRPFGQVVVAAGSGIWVTEADLGTIHSLWMKAVDRVLLPIIRAITQAARGWAMARLNLELPGEGGLVDEYLAGASNRLRRIGDTLWENARDSLRQGIEAGEGVPELRDRVLAAVDVSMARATAIARTEVRAANNGATFRTMLEVNEPGTTKGWLSTHDHRTRATHRRAGGQVVDLHEPFRVGEALLQFPCDPSGPPDEIIQCRCAMAFDFPSVDTALTADAGPDFNFKHPRDDDGQFAKKSGGKFLRDWDSIVAETDESVVELSSVDWSWTFQASNWRQDLHPRGEGGLFRKKTLADLTDVLGLQSRWGDEHEFAASDSFPAASGENVEIAMFEHGDIVIQANRRGMQEDVGLGVALSPVDAKKVVTSLGKLIDLAEEGHRPAPQTKHGRALRALEEGIEKGEIEKGWQIDEDNHLVLTYGDLLKLLKEKVPSSPKANYKVGPELSDYHVEIELDGDHVLFGVIENNTDLREEAEVGRLTIGSAKQLWSRLSEYLAVEVDRQGLPSDRTATEIEYIEEGLVKAIQHGDVRMQEYYRGLHPDPDGLRIITSAAEVHTGGMVALVPSQADCERLALKDGEPCEQLHLTIAYLGEAAQVGPEHRANLIRELSEWTAVHPPIVADAFAADVFNPHTDERDTALVLGISGKEIDEAHRDLGGLAQFHHPGLPEQHRPFVAHVTLAYTDDLERLAEAVDRLGPIQFDRVRLALGDEVTDMPLTGISLPADEVTTAAGVDNNPEFNRKHPRGIRGKFAKKGLPGSGGGSRSSKSGEGSRSRRREIRVDPGVPYDEKASGPLQGKEALKRMYARQGREWTEADEQEYEAFRKKALEYDKAIPDTPFTRKIMGKEPMGPMEAPPPIPVPRRRGSAPAQVHELTPGEAQKLREQITGDDERSQFMRRALEDQGEFAKAAKTFVAYDKDGAPVGALTLVDHAQMGEFNSFDEYGEVDPYDIPTPYVTIDAVGVAEGSNAGRDLVRQAIQYASDRGMMVYAEPLANSAGFWERMGFTPDPLDEGLPFVGLDTVQQAEWLHNEDTLTASVDTAAKERDVNLPGEGHDLRNYWVRGPGAAKVRWHTPGAFNRCVAALGDHVKNPQGLCAEYHKAATGEWPGQKRRGRAASVQTAAVRGDCATCPDVGEMRELPTGAGPRWRGVLAVEDVETGDGRIYAGNGFEFAPFPWPLMYQPANVGQHQGSVVAGRVDRAWREGNKIWGEGVMDLGSELGTEAHRQLDQRFLRGVSVDLDKIKEADLQPIYAEGATPGVDEPEKTIINRSRIRGATLVQFPAFVEAQIELVPEEDQVEPLVASGHVVTIAELPPADWFEEPADAQKGSLTITDEGRIYGYLAPAGVAHRGYPDRRITVPMGNVDYSRFMGGYTMVQGGERIQTGAVTMECGHAARSIGQAEQRLQHYDNSCAVVASVRVGENHNGVWVAGAVYPWVTGEQFQKMLQCRLSGDWINRRDRPGREFLAALMVPVPGFAQAATKASLWLESGVLVAAAVPVALEVSDGGVDLESARQQIAKAAGLDLASQAAVLAAQLGVPLPARS